MPMGSATEALLRLAKERGALSFGEFKLSSGATSSYYFDGRLITLDPEGAYLVARAFLPARDKGPQYYRRARRPAPPSPPKI